MDDQQRSEALPQRRSADDVIIQKEQQISASPEIVFAVLTDFQLFVELEEGVERVTITSEQKEGMGVTSRWDLIDQSTGERWSLDEEVIRWDRPRSYAYVGYGRGKDYSGVHTLTADPDGTTHHTFSEAFYFPVDRAVYDQVVGGLMNNVKRISEMRAATGV